MLFAGLKGAVPILLGGLIREAHVPGGERLFGIVVIVVVFSVLVQGSLSPTVARLLHLPMRTSSPNRGRSGCDCATSPTASTASPSTADRPPTGTPSTSSRTSVMTRGSASSSGRRLVRVTGTTCLYAGDDVLVLAEPEFADTLDALFTAPPGAA